MTIARAGEIVWHDLFAANRDRAMAFYERVAGWTYRVERATDFAWGGGEKDFVLALSGEEAGAGFAETPPSLASGWIAYVEVPDVDAAVARAQALGGETVHPPFEVPGVGRNALVRDPLGALVGVSLSRHTFPVPHRQFGPETYASNGAAFPETFYARLFGWRISQPQTPGQKGNAIVGSLGEPVAVHRPEDGNAGPQAVWLPSIRVTSPDDAWRTAEALGARSLENTVTGTAGECGLMLCDPDGALFVLDKARTGPP